jgi:hypothetical protein
LRWEDDLYYVTGPLYHDIIENFTKGEAVEDFLVFSKMAVLKKVIPKTAWSWDSYIDYAIQQLPYTFDIDDAQEKYGSQNLFLGAIPGKRSLRFTAREIYGDSHQSFGGPPPHPEVHPLRESIHGVGIKKLLSGSKGESTFQEVGGVKLWSKLLDELPAYPVLGMNVKSGRPADMPDEVAGLKRARLQGGLSSG